MDKFIVKKHHHEYGGHATIGVRWKDQQIFVRLAKEINHSQLDLFHAMVEFCVKRLSIIDTMEGGDMDDRNSLHKVGRRENSELNEGSGNEVAV